MGLEKILKGYFISKYSSEYANLNHDDATLCDNYKCTKTNKISKLSISKESCINTVS